MKIHVLVFLLLVCGIVELLHGVDASGIELLGETHKELVDAIKKADNEELAPYTFTAVKEVEAFLKQLAVLNDDGNIVKLSLTEDDNSEDSEEEKKNLPDRVKFRLYTRQNSIDDQKLFIDDEEALASSNFDAKKRTYFITHGWMSSGDSEVCTLIRDAYLENGDVNVIVVDWSKIANKLYVCASRQVVMVGQQVAKLINFLVAHANLDGDNTGLVGHSLGAHVMGLSGFYSNCSINHIVGLDPALPLFEDTEPGQRISTLDATHVQNLHTNAGFLGFKDAIGDSDFYLNGGIWQPGCAPDIGVACPHLRAYEYFAESINSDVGFYGKMCNSYSKYKAGRCKHKLTAVMGGPNIDSTPPGKYFLMTNSKPLYAKGKR